MYVYIYIYIFFFLLFYIFICSFLWSFFTINALHVWAKLLYVFYLIFTYPRTKKIPIPIKVRFTSRKQYSTSKNRSSGPLLQLHKKILGARIRELPRYENFFRIFHFPSKGSYRFARNIHYMLSEQTGHNKSYLPHNRILQCFDIFAFSYFAFLYFVYVLAKRKRSIFATILHTAWFSS